MAVNPVGAAEGRNTGAAQLLLLQGDADFVARLTLGQIIKGRVLLAYDGQRYAVEFDGQRKVVDSALPLKPGEVIHGRVIGLADKVTLQRVRVTPEAAEAAAEASKGDLDAGGAAGLASAGGAAGIVSALFDRYQARIPPADLALLQRLAARAPSADAVALAGLVLAKVGLPIASDLVRALQSALADSRLAGVFAPQAQAVALNARSGSAGAEGLDVPALAAALERALAELPEALRAAPQQQPGSDGADDQEEAPDLARWILNAQSGGAVAHRVSTLPLLLDGELVELDVALFSQQDDPRADGGEPPALRHRELVFELSTAALGRVEVRAQLAGGHARLQFAADSSETTGWLAAGADDLAAALQRGGVTVDEQRYASRRRAAPGAVVERVVEHLISPGSVSRLA